MWRLKLKLDASKQLLGALAIKYQVSMTGYPLSYWKDKNYLYLFTAGLMYGAQSNKTKLVNELKKNKNIIEFERSKDFAISVTRQPLFTEPVYSPQIIRPEPVIIHKDGYHIWDLASFNRKTLEATVTFATTKLDAKILRFRQEKISNINFTQLLPELTDLQKKAMHLAIQEGYYEYPKQVNMETLAKRMRIAYSTFQAHLKKAEAKLIPEIFKKL